MRLSRSLILKKSFNLFVVAALVPLSLLFLTLLFSVPPKAIAQQEVAYAGIDQCAACHEEVVPTFKDSIHWKKGFEQRSDKACETCHGPGAPHADAQGDKTKIKSTAALSSEEKSEMCLQCHEKGGKMFWMGSAHESRGLACLTCHSVHNQKSEKAQLSQARATDLCFSYHKQKEAQFLRASHHRIREGKVGCSDCHNPHGSQTGKLIAADSAAENCYKCHAEKRGPFLWEHMPVREDCGLCHEAHGSNHLKLMKVKEPFLCQRCHSDTRHSGTLYDQNALNSFSDRLVTRSCANRHSPIQGSNHPSG